MIISWILGKKIFTTLNKHLLNGGHNATINIFIYVIDLCIFAAFRPFRDNMVQGHAIGHKACACACLERCAGAPC